MPTIGFIYGTRPELIKIAPVVNALRDIHRVKLISTGQHQELLHSLYDWFELGGYPDLDLEVMRASQTPGEVISAILSGLEDKLAGLDLVIVQGDTASAMAGALGAFLHKIPVAHLEAGLRTNDRYSPFPEEIFRRQVSQLATYHFTPTQRATANLASEGIKDQVYCIGNSVIDALKFSLDKLSRLRQNDPDSLTKKLNLPFELRELEDKRLLLVTMHRRENLGGAHAEVAAALAEMVREYDDLLLVFPVHPNPQVRQSIEPALKGLERVKLIDPVNYVAMCYLLDRAYMLATDSGGLQEEATSLGKPTLILRNTTERPEAVESGVCTLVGTDREKIKLELKKLFDDEVYYRQKNRPSLIFGDGLSCVRMVEFLNCLNLI
ncbi:MAG: UDP-N-acetylglucosamine 2-epimerase (non-hydrolyzing) [Candidatus Caenarcaniphilales bacterium]|nr:UDP-N-acetylglucosamine 2-epimerase (non-hydrolyzing) [Candidatus Caenarcaniphilales bacterium]